VKLNLFKKSAAAGPVICKRPNGTVYAVVSPARWRELRGDVGNNIGDGKRLNEFLQSQRDAGIIIDFRRDF
jgi:hypothetical protein